MSRAASSDTTTPSRAARPLRLLMLEDNPSDAELVLHALRRAGFAPSAERVETERDYRTHLARGPEIILADFSMPEFDSLRALEIMQECDLDIPFIIVSGTIGEERAVDVIRRGATDYVMKDRLGRLGQAVAGALERNGASRRIRESEARIHELTAHIHQVLWMIDAQDAKVLYVSRAYEEVWGRTCQSLLDAPRSYLVGIHPADQDMMRREDAVMHRTGHIDVECRVLRPDGGVRWVWIRGYPVLEGDRIARIAGVIEDVTEKRRVASERDALLSRLQLHIERMPLAYVLFDDEFRITDWNESAVRIFGYAREEMLGAAPPYEKLVPRSGWPKGEELRRRIRAGDMDAHAIDENLTKGGRTITCQWFNTPLLDREGKFIGCLCLAEDVTEQKSLESQFRQAQKMEAVGRLAGGVAHDFNNLLTVINGFGEIVMDRLPIGDPARDMLREVVAAGGRAAGLTRQLLAFSRKAILEPRILDLKAVVGGVEPMLRRLVGGDIELTIVGDADVGAVRADVGQLEQVIVNLVVNAGDAMPEGGRLTIEVRGAVLDETYVRDHPDAEVGRHVCLVVSDTGCGIDEATKPKIFEPFFTTKGERGTGLGLATVHGIVKQSGGHVGVYSEVGHGTTFKVYLPWVESPPTAVRPDRRPIALPRGHETVLFVEDQQGVRALSLHALREVGYTVLEARDGVDALRVAAQTEGRIDLVVTDVVMPRMGGRELAERLAATRPDARVLFLSGYTDDTVVRHGILEAHVAFLQKPFSPASLVVKVRETLDGQVGVRG